MTHEKILKRPDGSRVKVVVELICDFDNRPYRWKFTCHHCAKGKRTFISAHNDDDYLWRRLGPTARDVEERRRYLTLATEEEVRGVMLELLAKIKPVV